MIQVSNQLNAHFVKESCYVAVKQQNQDLKLPLVSSHLKSPLQDNRQSERALAIRSGLIRGLAEKNWCFLPEMTLANGRRADLTAIDNNGVIFIIEIKSSIEDFRVDTKWHEYRDFCDGFYFATLADVPAEIFPPNEGFIVADKFGCEIIRETNIDKLSAARRKATTLRFARSAATMLGRALSQEEQNLMDL